MEKLIETMPKLSIAKSLNMDKLLADKIICQKCKGAIANSLDKTLCKTCYMKQVFMAMPPEQQRLYMLKTVPERYIDAELEHLPKELVANFKKNTESGIFLWGPAGSGKTYSMCALAKSYLRHGYKVERIHYEMLCLKIRDTYNPKATQTEFQLLEPLLNCDRLFIEDIGVAKGINETESANNTRILYLLMEMRLEHYRPIFMTSNKSLENITYSFGERIGDRLKLFQIIKLSGKSKREP